MDHSFRAERVKRLRAHDNFKAVLIEYILWAVGAAPGRSTKYRGNLENFLLEREILHLDLMERLRSVGRGATLTELQTFAARHNVCSARRVSQLVAQLIGWGRIQQVASGNDGRVRRLIPGEPLLTYQISCHERSAHLIRMINPSSTLTEMLASDPPKREAYMLSVGELFHSGVAAPLNVGRIFRLMSFDAGMAILYALLYACVLTHGEVRGGAPFRFIQAKTAESLGISRSHIRNFIDKALQLGLLELGEATDRSMIALSDIVVEEWTELVAFVTIRADEAVRLLGDPGVIGLGDATLGGVDEAEHAFGSVR